jgi:hypothetical protein
MPNQPTRRERRTRRNPDGQSMGMASRQPQPKREKTETCNHAPHRVEPRLVRSWSGRFPCFLVRASLLYGCRRVVMTRKGTTASTSRPACNSQEWRYTRIPTGVVVICAVHASQGATQSHVMHQEITAICVCCVQLGRNEAVTQ